MWENTSLGLVYGRPKFQLMMQKYPEEAGIVQRMPINHQALYHNDIRIDQLYIMMKV